MSTEEYLSLGRASSIFFITYLHSDEISYQAGLSNEMLHFLLSSIIDYTLGALKGAVPEII